MTLNVFLPAFGVKDVPMVTPSVQAGYEYALRYAARGGTAPPVRLLNYA